MADTEGTTPGGKESGAFRKYAWIRIFFGVVIVGVMLWVAGMVLGYFEKPGSLRLARDTHKSADAEPHGTTTEPVDHTPDKDQAVPDHGKADSDEADHGKEVAGHDEPDHGEPVTAPDKQPVAEHDEPAHDSASLTHDQEVAAEHGSPAVDSHAAAGAHGAHGAAERFAGQPQGVAFVSAVIEPLRYEFDDRFWGWRPNDIVRLGDNVINFQLGVLEVTRRAAIQLNDRISRTSTTAKLESELENAMNWFMVKPDQYWFPSPETKYIDSLEELEIYKERLKTGDANFFARTDNLLPLLAAFVDLLGSCDENLVKMEEKTGEPVPFYKADDYFFYAKGVASGMHPILEAIMVDFNTVLVNRDGIELLHHAIASLDRARHISPWVITDADPSGILSSTHQPCHGLPVYVDEDAGDLAVCDR